MSRCAVSSSRYEHSATSPSAAAPYAATPKGLPVAIRMAVARLEAVGKGGEQRR
jgi:hypothetical protein